MINELDDFINSQDIPEEAIFIESETLEQASRFSQSILEPHQWQAFLNYLSLEGFRAWLNSREPDWEIDERNSPWRELDYLQWPIVPNLIVGQMKVCLLVTEMLPDDDLIDDTDGIVEIPQEFLQRSDFANHLYVVVSVLEEDEMTVVQGYLRYDQIQDILKQPTTTDTPPGTIGISFSQLDPDLNHLLLYLRLPEFAGITLPEPTVSTTVASISSVISETLAQVADLSQVVVKSINLLATELQAGWDSFKSCKTELVGAMLSSRSVEEEIQKWAEEQNIIEYNQTQAMDLLAIDEHEIRMHIAVETSSKPTNKNDSESYQFFLLLEDQDFHGLPETIQIDLAHPVDGSLVSIDTVKYKRNNRRFLAQAGSISTSQPIAIFIKVSNQVATVLEIALV